MENENGFSLVEVIISLAIIGIIAVAFLTGLATASTAFLITDEQATARNVAESQMENLKDQAYNAADDYDPGIPLSGEALYEKITEIPETYTIWSVNRAGDTAEDIIGVPWDSDPVVNQPLDIDADLQKIRLVVKHRDKEIIALAGYKVNQ